MHEFGDRLDDEGYRTLLTEVEAIINSLQIFRIGLSWGGVISLAVVYPDLDRPGQDYGGRLVRLNVGLEQPSDLICDLEDAMTGILG